MKYIFYILFILSLQTGCSNKKSLEQGSAASEKFQEFYIRFNKDTVFQKSRIRCTIPGKVNFDIPNLDNTIYKVKTNYEEDMVTEKVTYKPDTSYFVKYNFKLENGKWFLVSYLDTWDD
ncbi:MAG: hypothetical protein AABY93_03280 [Bacteroidota bacterium]